MCWTPFATLTRHPLLQQLPLDLADFGTSPGITSNTFTYFTIKLNTPILRPLIHQYYASVF